MPDSPELIAATRARRDAYAKLMSGHAGTLTLRMATFDELDPISQANEIAAFRAGLMAIELSQLAVDWATTSNSYDNLPPEPEPDHDYDEDVRRGWRVLIQHIAGSE